MASVKCVLGKRGRDESAEVYPQEDAPYCGLCKNNKQS